MVYTESYQVLFAKLLSKVVYLKGEEEMILKCGILSKCNPTMAKERIRERIRIRDRIREKREISLTVAHYNVWHVFLYKAQFIHNNDKAIKAGLYRYEKSLVTKFYFV